MTPRRSLSLIAALALAGCATVTIEDSLSKDEEAAAEAIDYAADPASWRDVDPENLLRIDTPYGFVWGELDPDFAPEHVAQMKRLAREGHFNAGASFYRVIDGFVAQGGVFTEEEGDDGVPPLVGEFELTRAAFDAAGLTFTPLGSPDLFAPEAGSVGGFAAARDDDATWLLHCPGVIAMARDEAPDTGSSHFYIVLDAQRYLDRNLTVFGRVIDGMEFVQKLNRGDRAIASGVIQEPERRDPILSIAVAADLPTDEVPAFQVMRTEGPAFEAAKEAKRVRDAAFFFHHPPEVIDACFVPAPVRVAPEG